MKDKVFFELNPRSKTPKLKGWKGKPIKFDELNNYKAVGFMPPKGYVMVDADTPEAVKNIENTNKLLNLKVFSYNTTHGKHFVYKKPEGKYFERISSQPGNSIFIDPDNNYQSYIDIKCQGKKAGHMTQGYVKVKDVGVWRVHPDVLLKELETAPICPLVFLVGKARTDIRFSLKEYVPGERDTYMFKKTSKFKQNGWTLEQFIRFCMELSLIAHDEENLAQTRNWAIQKWESASTYESFSNPKEDEDFEEIIEIIKNTPPVAPMPLEEVVETTSVLKDWFKFGASHKKSKVTGEYPNGTIFTAKGIKSYEGLAKAFLNLTKIKLSDTDKQYWGMEFGEYQPIYDFKSYMKRIIAKEVGEISPTLINQAVSYIECVIPTQKFDNNEFLIQFKNKNIDVESGEEVEKYRDKMARNIIPWNIITENDMQTTHKEANDFLLKTFNGWFKNKDLPKQVFERIGLAMTRYMGHEKAYFLLGKGGDGKSAFLKLINKAFGERNSVQKDLAKLNESQFATSGLYGKLINTPFEISERPITNSIIFKNIVSGDRIDAEKKGSDSFSFEPYATMFFGANSIPLFSDSSKNDAIVRRLEVIPFTRAKNHLRSEKEKRDFMKQLLKDDKTVEVLLYNALEAIKTAFKGGFTTSNVSTRALNNIKKEQNQLLTFIEENEVKTNESEIEAYTRYAEWTKRYNHKELSYTDFLKSYIISAESFGIYIEQIEDDSKSGPKKRRLISRGKDI